MSLQQTVDRPNASIASEVASTLRGMRVVDLSPTLERGIPNWPLHPPLVIDKARETERDGYYCQLLMIAEHTGTHVDSPVHFHPSLMHMSIDTFPADGKTVAPGVLIVKGTFDQKMNPDGWDYGKGSDAYPQCLDRPRLLPDEKTFVLLCTAPSKSKFSMTFDASGSGGFENLAGQKATMASLSFITDDGKSIASIADAMKAAQLKPDEGPVMDSKPAALAPDAPKAP